MCNVDVCNVGDIAVASLSVFVRPGISFNSFIYLRLLSIVWHCCRLSKHKTAPTSVDSSPEPTTQTFYLFFVLFTCYFSPVEISGVRPR